MRTLLVFTLNPRRLTENLKLHRTQQFSVNEGRVTSINRGFLKIDHPGSTARIVLEQNIFSKRVISNKD